jgi:hypothetical protein
LLIPWHQAVWVFYLATSLAVIAIAASLWKSSASRELRFSGLILASVLVNPHIYIYDLLVLAPVFLFVANYILSHAQPAPSSLIVFLYLAFLLPLLGPLAHWTHLQLSVLAFVALLWFLWRSFTASSMQSLAPNDSRVV